MGNTNQPKTYDEHVKEAFDDVKTGQHLRFINELYRTKDVCLAAVTYESINGTLIFDLYSVPSPHLEFVMENIRELKKDERDRSGNKRSAYLENLEEAYNKITKKQDDHPLPDTEFSSNENIPKSVTVEHEAVISSDDYDNQLREIFFKKFGESAI